MKKLEVLQQHVTNCFSCDLHLSRTKVVFSRGNPLAKLLLIGEAPGADEDKTGYPFMGRSGNLLNKILINQNVNIQEDIYICNIIKCRPPNNRKPTQKEINNCIKFLLDQINLVNPKCIITLGNSAFQGLTSSKNSISSIRGSILDFNGIKLIPTYHPSFLLRNGGLGSTPSLDFIKDINLALKIIKG